MEHLNILVCEDERLFAMELSDRLKCLGHTVLGVASSGSTAVKLADQLHPDIALMDIRLEGEQSGIEIAKVLRSKFDVPSIYLTAYADQDTVDRAKQAFPVGYIVKPVQDRELQMALEFGVAQHRLQQSLRDQIQDLHTLAQGFGVHIQPQDGLVTDSSALDLALKMEEMKGIIEGVAHHFNNSLTVMYGHLSMLLEGKTLKAFERRQLMYALAACERQREVVRRLSLASSIGNQFSEAATVQATVEECIKEFEVSLPKQIELNIDITDKPLRAFIDREAVKSALHELLINAQESIIGSGKISVSLTSEFQERPECFNTIAVPGWYAVISVSDTGKGIPQEELRTIFEPFYTTHANLETLGLGLSVAYGVAHKQAGWLTLDSKEGEGTTAKFYLPQLNKKKEIQLSK